MEKEKRFNIYVQKKFIDSIMKVRLAWSKRNYSLKSVQSIIFMANLEKAKLAAPLLKILEENGDKFSSYNNRTSGSELRKQFIKAISIILEAENTSLNSNKSLSIHEDISKNIEQEKSFIKTTDNSKPDDFELEVKENEEEVLPDFFFKNK